MQDNECLTVSLPSVARLLGISRGLCYQLAQRDELPVKVIRCGKRLLVSRKAIEILLSDNGGSRGKEDEHS